MLSLIKPINFKVKKRDQKIKLDKIKQGVNCFDDFIILKKNQKLTVYDRNCDHEGGKIISKNGKHICPMHNWKFDPLKGIYKNGFKKEKKDYLIDKDHLVIDISEKIPKISEEKKAENTKIRFFNHAFIKIYGDNFSFATDPWALGPAFNTGWWLKNKTKNDWITELNNCSFIYISHNHPDHLHPLTLRRINKSMNFVVPNFLTDSTGKYLEDLGFKNIHRLKFAHEYKMSNTNLIFSILKSGDFREDSGIYFSNGNFTCLFDVDSNSINFNRFPEVDFYASSFAGGASGYPIMFDNFNSKEKSEILNRNKMFLKMKKTKIFKQTKALFFMPYAGFFIEKLKRDSKVNKLQDKNNISDYSSICKKNNINLLDVEKKDEYYFKGKDLIKAKNKKIKYFEDLKPEEYLETYKKNFNDIDINFIKNYFENSFFKDNLILTVSLVDDIFSNSKLDFKIDFSGDKPNFSQINNFSGKINSSNGKKQLYLKCRLESFLNTIYNKEPWEDLSIGFQCKVSREPNEYNYKFWYHFSNNYITSKNVRYSTDCNNCDKLNQYIDKEINIKNSI
tara:strand:- start:2292 stop:3980 length:1689 start_codon:yes stop_codon:yes gene_type:complete